jgi:hypothetical protein
MSTFTEIIRKAIDVVTGSINVTDYAHHEKHEGDDFFVLYSVASLGAATTPDDMMTLTFTTPDTKKFGHFTFKTAGTAGWRTRMIEAPTGGAATATGSLEIWNSLRSCAKCSTFKDLAGTAGYVSYDATLATGGNLLWDEYVTGASGPFAVGTGSGHDEEIILNPNTTYQLSLYGTDTDAGTLKIGWYEHTTRTVV